MKFTGLSPFEVLETPTSKVFDLYVDIILNTRQKGIKTQEQQWVTSENATWH